ncbi:MAG: hypothetical protein KGR98_09145 [Verrucomicrobia bacterium]|nr:hypothetical protein [Verrucomicrobiota bacterium]
MTRKVAIHHSEPMFRLAGTVAKFGHTISAKMRHAIESLAPIGYQDNKGFHYGVRRSDDGLQWPPVS